MDVSYIASLYIYRDKYVDMIYIYICMYVCMYVCMYTHMYIYIYIVSPGAKDLPLVNVINMDFHRQKYGKLR